MMTIMGGKQGLEFEFIKGWFSNQTSACAVSALLDYGRQRALSIGQYVWLL